ncbi:MAG: hypothetical protein HZC38_08955 [Chloroflexi bacterium]|nr:hypothetical protein [Chloroflexota bacterium]MBI5082035.1 hypothetical protein [Chloroflexota bacterium]MBI5713533.1 hypothetical protein [Chloroflexota bacterium]
MRYIRIQLLIAFAGLGLVGVLLFLQSQGLVTTVVAAQGGTHTEAVVGFIDKVNPLLDGGSPVDRDLDKLIFSGLMRFDDNGLPIPDLAETWAVSADGLTYTFVLRNGLQWHDGQPVTENDVLFTIGLMQDPEFPGAQDVASLWRKIQISAPAPRTVQFILSEPFAPFLDYTTVGLLPEHILRGVAAKDLPTHPFNREPIGTGAMRLVRLESKGGAVTAAQLEPFSANADHPYYLSQVHLRFFPDEASAYQAFAKGEVLGVSQFTPETFSLALKNPNTLIYSSRLPQYTMIFLNHKSETVPHFQDKKVRQAMLAALNRQLMVDTLLHGQALVATGPILPGTWAYNNNLIPVSYDPSRADQLLTDAGWAKPTQGAPGSPDYARTKSRKPFTFTLLAPNDPTHAAVAKWVADNWAQMGIQAKVDLKPIADVRNALNARQFDAALIDLTFANSPDPDPYPFWHQTQIESGQNFSGFDSRNMSEILEQARVTPSYADRAKFYRAFQTQFVDQTPAILLYYPVFNYAVDKKVRGVQLGPLVDRSDRFNNLYDWYIITRRVISNTQP